jgi:hypothetical protein
MALAAYSTKLRLPSYELEALFVSLGLEDKLSRGVIAIDYARTTRLVAR